MTIPLDLQAFLNLIASQAFIGLLISWLIEHIPFMQDPAVKNWLKLIFALLVCIAWVVISTLIVQGGLPHDASGVYAMLMTAVAVIFTNQAAYKLIDNIPALRDFLLLLFGKPTVTLTSGYIQGASIKTTTTVDQPATVTSKPSTTGNGSVASVNATSSGATISTTVSDGSVG